MLDVFEKLDIPNVKLVIVGGDDMDVLSHRLSVNKSIFYLGQVDNREVHRLMEACDIGVVPSLNEQCSYVVLEMMSHAMAIIASDIDGMGELFLGKDIALTIPVECISGSPRLNKTKFMEHIVSLCVDGDLRNRLGKNSYSEWKRNYTAKRMANETFEVYKELEVKLR